MRPNELGYLGHREQISARMAEHQREQRRNELIASALMLCVAAGCSIVAAIFVRLVLSV